MKTKPPEKTSQNGIDYTLCDNVALKCIIFTL